MKVSGLLRKINMKGSIYIDSNFLIAALVENHPFHTEAIELFHNHSTGTFSLSLLTLDEVLYTFRRYKIPAEKVMHILQTGVFTVKNIDVLSDNASKESAIEYISLWEKSSLHPRDALHLFFMKMYHISTIATFDEDFINRQRELGISVLK